MGLTSNPNTSAILNSAPVATALNGSTIPQLCTGFTVTVQTLLPQIQLSLNLLKPFANLTGLDPVLKGLWQALNGFNGLSANDPKVEGLLMTSGVAASLSTMAVNTTTKLFLG